MSATPGEELACWKASLGGAVTAGGGGAEAQAAADIAKTPAITRRREEWELADMFIPSLYA